MVNRVGSISRFDTSSAPKSSLQLVFDLPPGTRWIRLKVNMTSSDSNTIESTLKGFSGAILATQNWAGLWIDEIFVRVPPDERGLVLEPTPSVNVHVVECRVQPISSHQMWLIATGKKLKLLRDYGCTTRVLRRGLGLLLKGQFGEFRQKLLRGVDDSRFISTDENPTFDTSISENLPTWAVNRKIDSRVLGRRFVILTPSLSAGDAVSNDVLGMAYTLRAAGAEVLVCSRFASKIWPVVAINRLPEMLRPQDTLIYHHSIGFTEAVRLFEKLPCRKILKYHNITPPELLREQSPELSKACEQGLAELPRLRERAHAVLVDSPFNAANFPAQAQFEILPPFNQIDELLQVEPQEIEGVLPGILVVGRVVPNKNIEKAIETLAFLRKDSRPELKLYIVGSIQSWDYVHKLKSLAEKLDIQDDVQFLGNVTPQQLKGLYKTALVLLCTSLHEGFGLPLLEAAALKLPIVAVPNGAIPATVDGCGWMAADIPETLGRTILRTMENSGEREIKLMLGERHYRKHYTNSSIADRFLDLLHTSLRVEADPLLQLSRAELSVEADSQITVT
ncbi:glycosyltransferase [Telmatocola sphagniphila]|uniref:Glycosyltransferase n=1 Tax=Telmatocola sphagniphila TaxID=1123043 RepID=A0A8E6EW71_9BACT|nr:glycosyltransferase [Telmatocola sphagniphila]QVL33685.1 glycosyltransferase [Telmatocola sphagniphila]